MELLPRVSNAPPWLWKPKDPRWKNENPASKKFIDDGIFLVKINMRNERLLYIHGKPVKQVHDSTSQAMFDHICNEAPNRGMRVNDTKTSLMCVSAATSFLASAMLIGRDNVRIESQDHMKILGFTLDHDGGISSHVENLRERLRSQTWALLKLKCSGFTSEELVSIYNYETFSRICGSCLALPTYS